MRVIAGSARRLQLKTVEGMETRPTTDRIKETLFNMIGADLIQTQFLDCFAGSGGIGIEALSRGASKAVFIEKNPKAVECIRQNLKTTHLEEKALVKSESFRAVNTCFSHRQLYGGSINTVSNKYSLPSRRVMALITSQDMTNAFSSK